MTFSRERTGSGLSRTRPPAAWVARPESGPVIAAVGTSAANRAAVGDAAWQPNRIALAHRA